MILIPTLQVLEGRCVTLVRGKLDEPEVWHGDPVERALDFVRQGAERLHVTDLDQVARKGDNSEIVARIIREAGVPVQVAGGMSSDEAVRHWREAGAARIVFGRSAIYHLDWVKAKAKELPDYFMVSVDIHEGRVMADGWSKPALFAPDEFVRQLEGTPLAAIIVTDIDRDLELPDSSFALTTRLAEETRTAVVSSGLVKTLDDVSTLRYMPNLAGAMIGRPLYDRTIDLAEAIAIARVEPEPTAPFL